MSEATTRTQRARNRWRPTDYQTYRTFPDLPGTELYLFHNGSSPCALVFAGRSRKPSLHARFTSEDARDKRVAAFISALRLKAEHLANAAAERKAFRTAFVPGDVLSCSWGYDQTQVDFYQVISVTPSGKSIDLRPIKWRSVKETSGMSDTVVPIKDAFCGETFRKRVSIHESVTISSCQHARRWSGKPMHRSWWR